MGGGKVTLRVVPVEFGLACEFIDGNHRHRRAPVGHRFSLGCEDDGRLCGVATVGNCSSIGFRKKDFVLEVTRVATDGTRNACSKLYGAAWRATLGLCYRRCITYTLKSESGASLRAAGFVPVAVVRAQSWNRPSRRRVDRYPLEEKIRWERSA